MSEDVTYRGKLVLIETGKDKVEVKAFEILGGELEKHYSSYLEKLLDGEDYLYHSEYEALYSIEKTKFDCYGFREMSRNEDGSIAFFTQFYNGGTCLTEILEEGLDEI